MALGIGSLIGIGSSLLGTAFGIGQKISANKLEKNNVFVPRTVNTLIAENAAKAQQMGQIGIAQQQYNNALNQQNQNLSTVLGTASRSGRNIPLAGILRQSNLATQNLNAQDANARLQNQRFAMQQNQVLAQEQANVRNYNIEQPYLRTQQRVAELRNAGNQNIFGGIGNVASIGMSSLGQSGNTLNNQNTNAGITNYLPNQTITPQLAPLGFNVSTNGNYTKPNQYGLLNFGTANYGIGGRLV